VNGTTNFCAACLYCTVVQAEPTCMSFSRLTTTPPSLYY